MNNTRGIRINLASEPLINRRFFRMLFFALVVPLALAVLLSAVRFVGQQTLAGRLGEEVSSLRESVDTARAETKRLESRSRDLSKRGQAGVDFMNDVILRKSFSWVELLSRLEEALPASSSVVSIAPASAEGARAEMVLTAVFRNLNDLLSFIRNLYARGFTGVRLVSERNDGAGRLEAQIAVVYEGTV